MNSETMTANSEDLIGKVMSEAQKEIENMISGIVTKSGRVTPVL
jgi:ribosomal protein S17E